LPWLVSVIDKTLCGNIPKNCSAYIVQKKGLSLDGEILYRSSETHTNKERKLQVASLNSKDAIIS
jgi:hypothetical protein